MLKLLKGSFIRLFKSSEFQLIPFLLIISNVMIMLINRDSFEVMGIEPRTSLSHVLFHVMYINICIAAFTGLFVGTEYSDATVFNKIIFGHSRTSVFFTYLLTCLFSAAFFNLAAILGSTAIGWIVLGEPSFGFGEVIKVYFQGLPPLFTVSSLHVMLAVLLQNRAVGTGVSCGLSSVMLFVSAYLNNESNMENMLYDLLPDFYLMRVVSATEPATTGVAAEFNFPYFPILLFVVFTIAGLLIFNNINIRNTPEGEV